MLSIIAGFGTTLTSDIACNSLQKNRQESRRERSGESDYSIPMDTWMSARDGDSLSSPIHLDVLAVVLCQNPNQ